MEPQGGVLKDIVRIFPPPDTRETAEHPMGHQSEAFTADLENPVPGCRISAGQVGHTPGQGLREGIGGIHGGSFDGLLFGPFANDGTRRTFEPRFSMLPLRAAGMRAFPRTCSQPPGRA